MQQTVSGQKNQYEKAAVMRSVRAENLPAWVPIEARHYLAHTEGGRSIRELARKGGCAPSTVMRQVRKIEQQRDDPLIDEMLERLRIPEHRERGTSSRAKAHRGATAHKDSSMSKPLNGEKLPLSDTPNAETLEREARRVLRRLSEPGACLAIGKNMDNAVVVRELEDGRPQRLAVLERSIAQALALKGWIAATGTGKVARYAITSAGRSALRGFLAADESARAGFAEAPAVFGAAPEGVGILPQDPIKSKRVRYNAAESPVMVLARRRDKDGIPYLDSAHVMAAERLREDFELSAMSEETIDWAAYLAGQGRGVITGDVAGFGPQAAQARVAAVLDDLGYGLGDAVLRCCCQLDGMEQLEKDMDWSARSGKVVLKIALSRLAHHYDRAGYSNMIG